MRGEMTSFPQTPFLMNIDHTRTNRHLGRFETLQSQCPREKLNNDSQPSV